MNISETMTRIFLVVGTMILINTGISWWRGGSDDTVFVAPTQVNEQRVLDLEVDFLDKETENPEQLITVDTPIAHMRFTNRGATLAELTCVRTHAHTSMNTNGENKKQKFTVWDAKDATDRELNAFLVALDEKTPFYYTLIQHEDGEKLAKLVFEAKTEQGRIEKQFEISKELHMLTLTVTVKPKKQTHVRVLWPSPLLKELGEDEALSSIVINKNNTFAQQPEASLDLQRGYLNPGLFGTSDKYFVFALYKDTQNFAQRAYYKIVNRHVMSFLESKKIEEETSWNLGFYFGPKETAAMHPVDPRLEKSLNYGMFSFITRPLVEFLKYIDSYTHNYGWAIVIVTVLLKLLLFPFTYKSESKMKEFQESQRKLEYVNTKFKDDPEALERARLEHMKKHGVSGLLGGCLPMMLPLPLFIALSGALNNSLALYREPFIWWIQDLSKPDPYYVLSILAVIAILLSGLGAQGKKGTAAIVMPIVMALGLGTITAYSSAGLALYICLNMVLHMGQTKIQRLLGL